MLKLSRFNIIRCYELCLIAHLKTESEVKKYRAIALKRIGETNRDLLKPYFTYSDFSGSQPNSIDVDEIQTKCLCERVKPPPVVETKELGLQPLDIKEESFFLPSQEAMTHMCTANEANLKRRSMRLAKTPVYQAPPICTRRQPVVKVEPQPQKLTELPV
jgi:hypothetical protein